MRHALLSSLLLVLSAACATASSPSTTTAPTGNAEVLPFIEDDYPRALAEAKAKNLPLFLDAWATW